MLLKYNWRLSYENLNAAHVQVFHIEYLAANSTRCQAKQIVWKQKRNQIENNAQNSLVDFFIFPQPENFYIVH